MTEEEFEKKAKKYYSEYIEKFVRGIVGSENVKIGMIKAYKDGFNAGYSDGYETGKKNERELQCGKKHLENLAKENEALKKSALVWHKVTSFVKPDENGYITTDNPVEEGKEYLLKTKYGFEVDTLDYDDTGFFFEYDWSEIEAWAELPEVTE